MILKDDNGKKLPKEVQTRVNAFIDNLPKVNWFKPYPNLKKEDVEKQINFTLECFWVKAGIEYKTLSKQEDWASAWASAWDSARASAWDSARASAWDSARDSARASAWDSARASAWDSARASAWDSAWASQEILLEDNKDFKEKYPNWAFRQLFKLWEMWLYPVWVLKETWKFTVYADSKCIDLFKEESIKTELPNELNINWNIYILKI